MTNLNGKGYQVRYEYGDVCDAEVDSGLDPVRYSSEVSYLCNNQTEDIGWPELTSIEGNCHFKFQWRSHWACSICLPSQVNTIASSCDGSSRAVAYAPVDSCWIYEEPARIDILKTFSRPELPANQTVFVSGPIGSESCSLQDDFFMNPVIKGFLIGISLLWLTVTLTLLCLFCKYRDLKGKYSRLSDDSDAVPYPTERAEKEIEMKTL